MKRLLFLIPLAFGAFINSLQAAHVDYFLKLDGIDGESTDDRHRDQIHIESFSWGVNQTGSFGSTGGGGTGKVSFSDMTFSTKISKASPKLMLACATGQHIRSATFVTHRPDGDTNNFIKVTLTDVYITSYQTGGSGGDADPIPTDQFSLNFTAVKFEHTSEDGKITSGEAVRPTLQ